MGLRDLTLLLLQLVVIGMVLADSEDQSLDLGCKGNCDEAKFQGADENPPVIRNEDDIQAGDDELATDDALAVIDDNEFESQTESSTDIEPDIDASTDTSITTTEDKLVDHKEPRMIIPTEVARYPGPLLPGSPAYFLRPVSYPNPYAAPSHIPSSFWPQYPANTFKRYPPNIEANLTQNEVNERVDNTKWIANDLPPPNFSRYPIYRIPFTYNGPVIPPHYQPTDGPTTAHTPTTNQAADDLSSTQETQTSKYEPRLLQPYGPTAYFSSWRPYPPIRPVYYSHPQPTFI